MGNQDYDLGFEDVTVSIQGKPALQSISALASQGDLLAIMGPSGNVLVRCMIANTVIYMYLLFSHYNFNFGKAAASALPAAATAQQ